MPRSIAHFIQGRCLTESQRYLSIENPIDGSALAKVPVADHLLVDHTVKIALAAFHTWSKTPVSRRAKILFTLKQLLEAEIDSLAEIITQEHGKTLSDAKGSISRGIEVLELACGIPYLLKSGFVENIATNVDTYSMRQALGVCVGITPFNFPAMIPLWMFTLGIACGNTFILKPSEKNPSCALLIAELCQKAGLPDGVLNVLNGDKETVEALLTHPDVKAVSFVGSSPIAEYVYRTGTQNGKRVQAFGGAKNHCIIMPDANIDQVVDALVGAAYGSAGERCMAISVAVLVGESLADHIVDKLKPRVEALKIGNGRQADIEMGPLISKAHWERVKHYIDLGVKEGANLVVDGRAFKPTGLENGFFMGGSLFDHVKSDMQIYQEEIFGPVLCIVRVPDLERAIQLVNAHPFGNGTAIFTQSGYAARTFASEVEVGMVGINVAIPVPVPYQSFGGWKRSFFGDIGMQGSESVNFYTKMKVVTERWSKEEKSQTEFSITSLK